MIRILIFIHLLFFSIFQAQEKTSAALPFVLIKGTNTEIPQLESWLFENKKIQNADSLKSIALQNLQIARKNGDNEKEAKALLNLGNSYIVLGNYNEALKNFLEAENKLSKIHLNNAENKKLLAKISGSKGIAYSAQNSFAEALKSYNNAIEIYEELNEDATLSKVYNFTGSLYLSLNDDEKALFNFLKAYELQKKLKDSGIAITSSNIANVYLEMNQLQKAKTYLDEGLHEFNSKKNTIGLGKLYNSFAKYYLALTQPEIAKQNLEKAEIELQKNNDFFCLSESYLLLAKIYFDENNMGLSEKYANQGLELAKKLDLPETEMNGEKILYEINFKKGDQVNALIHLRNYDIGKEKLLKLENIKERLIAELDFEDEKDILRQEESANRNKIIFIFSGLILATGAIGFFIHYRDKEQRKGLLLQKQLAEYEHKALHLQMNPHFIFNCHAAISAFIMQNGKDEAVKYLAKFSKLMRLTLEFSKESSIPIDKEILSLQNYLELEQLRFNRKFEFKIIKDPIIEDDTAIPSLLLQPYIENAIIHGVVPKEGVGFIRIQFQQKNDTLLCEIEDNGVGIETSQKSKEGSVRAHKSMALEITKKRLETMEKLDKKTVLLTIKEIKSNEGKTTGTKVSLELPLEYIKN